MRSPINEEEKLIIKKIAFSILKSNTDTFLAIKKTYFLNKKIFVWQGFIPSNFVYFHFYLQRNTIPKNIFKLTFSLKHSKHPVTVYRIFSRPLQLTGISSEVYPFLQHKIPQMQSLEGNWKSQLLRKSNNNIQVKMLKRWNFYASSKMNSKTDATEWYLFK